MHSTHPTSNYPNNYHAVQDQKLELIIVEGSFRALIVQRPYIAGNSPGHSGILVAVSRVRQQDSFFIEQSVSAIPTTDEYSHLLLNDDYSNTPGERWIAVSRISYRAKSLKPHAAFKAGMKVTRNRRTDGWQSNSDMPASGQQMIHFPRTPSYSIKISISSSLSQWSRWYSASLV